MLQVDKRLHVGLLPRQFRSQYFILYKKLHPGVTIGCFLLELCLVSACFMYRPNGLIVSSTLQSVTSSCQGSSQHILLHSSNFLCQWLLLLHLLLLLLPHPIAGTLTTTPLCGSRRTTHPDKSVPSAGRGLNRSVDRACCLCAVTPIETACISFTTIQQSEGR